VVKNAVVIGARSSEAEVGGRSRQKNVERGLPVKKNKKSPQHAVIREVKEGGNPLKLKCRNSKIQAGKSSAALGEQRNKGAVRRCNLSAKTEF
jgi:hypothetical protein